MLSIIKVFSFAIIDTLFTIIACALFNWWIPIFCDDKGWLPNWLAWFQTFDDTLDAGRRDGVFNNKSVFICRVRWLYRNPGYGIAYWALGCPFNASEWKVDEYTPDPFRFHATGPNGKFNLQIIKFGIRIKIGWKAWNMYDVNSGLWKTTSWGPEMRIPFTFSISKA